MKGSRSRVKRRERETVEVSEKCEIGYRENATYRVLVENIVSPLSKGESGVHCS